VTGKRLNRALIFSILSLSACATAQLPDGFVYESSLRGQQGWYGAGERRAEAADLLASGVVTSPQEALEHALPDAEVNLQQWGVTYFQSDWTRYRLILKADVTRDGETTKCRLSHPETVKDAPLLRELTANGGEELQAGLERLVTACAQTVLYPKLDGVSEQ